MIDSHEARRLAGRLRELRTTHQPKLTQVSLARALSKRSSVAASTISGWESERILSPPPAEHLHSYALVFCSDRSNADPPRLLSKDELTADELQRFEQLHTELIALRNAAVGHARTDGSSVISSPTWTFDAGPIAIICPETPLSERPPMANEKNPNYTRMYRYADLDALVDLWGHIRAANPNLEVSHRLASEVGPDDLSGHVVVMGGIGWNQLTRRLLKALREMPVSQVEVDELKTGDIFRTSGAEPGEYWPVWEDFGDAGRELVEDVGLLARVRSPYNHSRTITICNGVHSRGVLGSVRALTDVAVRERNEVFLANRFPGGSFALLIRVPVVNGEAMSPDLEIDRNRLFEWSPTEKATAR
ncbi:helix-turn-helix transcriptional regulator [Kribbella sp. NPDC051770]|uniref:helix-turn-helix transcriptional regulator n=1 Tax=Kribbella sp. NPDC051770 TaxID=3155413 RepID=UPI0034244817